MPVPIAATYLASYRDAEIHLYTVLDAQLVGQSSCDVRSGKVLYGLLWLPQMPLCGVR